MSWSWRSITWNVFALVLALIYEVLIQFFVLKYNTNEIDCIVSDIIGIIDHNCLCMCLSRYFLCQYANAIFFFKAILFFTPFGPLTL